jgi:hypothetical protein
MSAENASALVGAALVTVTLFPTLALSARSAARASRPPDSIETALGRFSDAIATRVNDLLAAAMRNLPARW